MSSGGLLIYDFDQKKCRRLSVAEGLPSNYLRAVVLDGDKAWVGGESFVARVDLPSGRVEKACKLQAASRVRCMEIVRDEVWFSAGPGLYCLRTDGQVPVVPVLETPERRADATNNQPLDDYKQARTLMLESAELRRVYGTGEAEDVLRVQAKFQQTIRRIARSFPVLEPRAGEGTNRFERLVLNQSGAGFDGFRFRNPFAEPKNFGWVFGFESPQSMDHWYIAPLEEQKMRGFVNFFNPKRNYTNAPWSGTGRVPSPKVQWLRDGTILPGKEYIIWFSFRNAQPNTIHLAFDLFPATDVSLARSSIDRAFGLKGDVREDEFPPRNNNPAGIK
jgi:hypothetical protein